MNDRNVPLVTDLDDTLIHGDLLLETLLAGLGRAPFATTRLLLAHLGAPQILKIHLAERFKPDLDAIPRNGDIEATLKEARDQGRKIVLASGSTGMLVREFADRSGPFDAVFASDETTNLTSSRKAELLEGEYGRDGFDYIGDTTKDIKVWQSAQNALVARRSDRFLSALRSKGLDPQGIGQAGTWRDLASAVIRPQMRASLAVLLGISLIFTGGHLQILPLVAAIALLLIGLDVFRVLTAPDIRQRPRPQREGRARLDHMIVCATILGALGFVGMAAHGVFHALAAIAITAIAILVPRSAS